MLRIAQIMVCSLWLGLATTTSVVAQSEAVQQAQERLEALGLSPGPIDGLMGSRTRSAIREFQRRNKLPETGILDSITQNALKNGLQPGSPLSATEVTPAPLPPPSPLQPNVITAPVTTPPDISKQSLSTDLQTQTRSSQPDDSSGPGIYLVLMAVAFAMAWWLRRQFQIAAKGADRGRTTAASRQPPVWVSRSDDGHPPKAAIDQPKMDRFISDTQTRRPGRTEELRARVNAAAARRGLSPSSDSASDLATAWRDQQIVEDHSKPTTIETSDLKVGATRGWVPAGENAVVAGKNIGGMIYYGKPPTTARYGRLENAFIDPSLSVARRGDDLGGIGLHYWPSYSTIDARARATYLNWLASGRSDPAYNVGYVFLYFYGLERRYFQDKPDETERRAIVAEVKRLLRIYGENGSIRRYLGIFLESAKLVVAENIHLKPVFEKTGYEVPLIVRLGIGSLISKGEPIPAEWMLSWLCTHPERWLRTPAQRAFAEFKALFEIRFDKLFPHGLKIPRPRRNLQLSYRAASGNFTVAMTIAGGEMPDISGLSKPLDTAWEIADGAMNELDKFSRYLGRNPEGRGTIEAHALLPNSIKPLFPCPELEFLRAWVSERISAGGLVSVTDLLERLEGARPDSVGKRQLTSAADALGALAIGMAPDPRFALRSPKFGEPVVLFPFPEEENCLESTSDVYQVALLSITLGAFVAHADGPVSEVEQRHLEHRIENTAGLTISERTRLQANLRWLIAVPPDLTLFRRRLKDAGHDVRAELGRTALAVAGSDGHIDPSEIKAIQKLYGALGLEAGEIYSELHSLATSSEPILVHQPSSVGTGYTIPPNPALAKVTTPTTGVELDRRRIDAIMSDTARVSGVLNTIFADDNESEDDEEDRGTTTPPEFGGNDRLRGLDAKHRALVQELLRAETWIEEQFDALAGQFSLMPAGALETINEWAYERFDAPLLDEDECFIVNPEVAARLVA